MWLITANSESILKQTRNRFGNATRYFKIQLKSIDITTRLRGINPTIACEQALQWVTLFSYSSAVIVSKSPSWNSRDEIFEFSKMKLSQGRVTIFWAHIFEGPRNFGLFTWKGLKFLGPHLSKNTAPSPPIVNDRSLIEAISFTSWKCADYRAKKNIQRD